MGKPFGCKGDFGRGGYKRGVSIRDRWGAVMVGGGGGGARAGGHRLGGPDKQQLQRLCGAGCGSPCGVAGLPGSRAKGNRAA
jgi:hypothetical protein